MSSLSVEASNPEDSIIVALFETPHSQEVAAAWLEREHEYRFLAVRPESLDGTPSPRLAVRCALKKGTWDRLFNLHPIHGSSYLNVA